MALLDSINDPGGSDPSPYAFTPQTQSMAGQTSDIQNRLARQGVGSSGQPMIQNLLQLGAVAKSLSGVPTETRNMILAKLMGIPYRSPEDKAINLMKQRFEQGAPDRKIQQARLMESLRNRELVGRANLALRGKTLNATEANRKALMDFHNQAERDRIPTITAHLSSAMKQLTDSIPTMTDPTQKEAALKHLQALGKQFDHYQQRFNDLVEGDRQAALDANSELQDVASEGDSGDGSEGSAY
jgi:hypothetical protein